MKSSKIVMAAAMAAALASMGCKQALTKDEFIAASKDLQDSNSNVYTANQLKRTAWQDFSHELQSLFASTSEATVKKTAIEAKVTAFNAQQKKDTAQVLRKSSLCYVSVHGRRFEKG